MFTPVATKNPEAVEAATSEAYQAMFPKGDRLFIPRIFGWARDFFNGRYADYQPIDARYHDFEHTLQGTLCMARLLCRRQAAKAEPVLPQRIVELGFIAILFHDTGYLKKRDDNSGTGAKYTVTHVSRSAEFAAQFLAERSFLAREILSIQNMIRCTGVDATLNNIRFQSEDEKVTGHILGTADLLGQMAADDYVEKLPVLYAEFAEAAAFSGYKASVVSMFSSAKDLMYKTPAFWGNYVKLKLDRDFSGQFRHFSDPYPDGPNWYLDKIEANISRLREMLSNDTSRFKK
jgi:hypothetical protein